MKQIAAIAAFLCPQMGMAFEPGFADGAELLANVVKPDGVYAMPVGVFADDRVPTQAMSGTITTRSWRLEKGSVSPATITHLLREQVQAEGFDIALDCRAEICGGFGFRYNIDVLPPPDMFVDLSDFHFLSASAGTKDARTGLSILVSKTARSTLVQIVEVAATSDVSDQTVTRPVARPDTETETPSPDWSKQLLNAGHVVLDDLEFETGSSQLQSGGFASLDALAAWLLNDATRRVALVGHTDNQGAAGTNLELSQGRADAVMDRLVNDHGVSSEQLEARGVAYFAPVSTNETAEGREQNRRVEVVLLSRP